MILEEYSKSRSMMLYWYGLGLLLFSIGLVGVFLTHSLGTPLNWIARVTELLGGLYLIIATWLTYKTAKLRNISSHEALVMFFSSQKSNLIHLLDNIKDGVIVTDLNLIIVGWNAAAERIYGWSENEVIGKDALDMLQTNYPSKLTRSDLLRYVIEEGGWSIEVTQKDKKYDDVPILTSISALKDEDGQLNGLIMINQDITDRKKAEITIQKTMDELKRSNDELQRFAYVSSHDLQEPLRMVTSFTQLLERRYKGRLDGDADDYIGFIVDGAKRMKMLIDDLLAFSRLNTRSKPFQILLILKPF